MSAPPDDLVVLGKVAEAYGLQGWLRVHAFGDDPLSWQGMAIWWLRDERAGGDWQPCRLKEIRPKGDSIVIRLEGIDSRTAAEGLKGFLIGASRAALPATGIDEYYWDDLIGLAVINSENQSLGKIAGLIETGANAVMRVIDDGGTERLLPFVSAVVLAVDIAAGSVRVEWGADW